MHDDDMEGILTEIDEADAVVLGAPINLGNVTAIMKRFIERLGPYFLLALGQGGGTGAVNKENGQESGNRYIQCMPCVYRQDFDAGCTECDEKGGEDYGGKSGEITLLRAGLR